MNPDMATASKSVGEDSLCARCAEWDFNKLFQGDARRAHKVGPLKDPEIEETWDRRPWDKVQGNIDCKLCRFVVSIVTASRPPEKVPTASSKLYLEYRKQRFGYRSPGHAIQGPITTLSLELIDNWDPRECSTTLSSRNHPNLQLLQSTVDTGDVASNRVLKGRRMEAQIDFDLLRYWIKSCDSHGTECSPPNPVGQSASRIRLIDIKRRRLYWATTSDFYAALSYVWGPPSIPQIRLTKSSEQELFLDGSLAADNEAIPNTIRDAMIVCERLAIPNLWVDALCIEQDSPDFNVHLGMMNAIYAAAYVTIVAASGNDSWAGLPGVRPNSRETSQQSIIINDMSIGVAAPDFRQSVMRSPWWTRGWTFQERMFSRRLLIFADIQSFFYCDKATRFESTITEVDRDDEIDVDFTSCNQWQEARYSFDPTLDSKSNEKTLGNYFQQVREFRRLKLTYPSDVLRAFGGVLSNFERHLTSPFFFGLPVHLFTRALLLDYSQSTRRVEFPSWSWTGWCEDQFERSSDSNCLHQDIGAHDASLQATTVFYRLHPTLNTVKQQNKWFLSEIPDSYIPRAEENERADSLLLEYQELPMHLRKEDLEKLLVFDTLVARLEVSPVTDYSVAARGEQDPLNEMISGHISGMSSDDYLCSRPYFSKEWFANVLPNDLSTGETKFLEFALIAKGKSTFNGRNIVYLMLVDTDELGVSTRVSSAEIIGDIWARAEPRKRRVYLM